MVLLNQRRGLGRGGHKEAIIPSMSRPVGTIAPPFLLCRKVLLSVSKELINHCEVEAKQKKRKEI